MWPSRVLNLWRGLLYLLFLHICLAKGDGMLNYVGIIKKKDGYYIDF